MSELSAKLEVRNMELASMQGPRKAVPQALWGEEEQGSMVELSPQAEAELKRIFR